MVKIFKKKQNDIVYKFISFTILTLLTVSLIILVSDINYRTIFAPIIDRSDTLFDVNTSTRAHQMIMPLYWINESSILNFLFGHGPGSFYYLHLTKDGLYGAFQASSSNIITDFIYEYGTIGILIFFTMFFKLLRNCLQNLRNRYEIGALILFSHLLISSMYRTDFSTPRFWILFIIITLLMEIGGRYNEKYNKNLYFSSGSYL